MRRNTRILGAALLAAAIPSGANTLVVRSRGFSDTAGVAVVQVFGKGASITKGPAKARVPGAIVGNSSVVRIDDLPAGKWAVMVFHDKNRNGTLDHGWNRMPQEDMGFTNGFVPTLFSGMPTWEKLGVELPGPVDTLDLVVRSFSLTHSNSGDEK